MRVTDKETTGLYKPSRVLWVAGPPFARFFPSKEGKMAGKAHKRVWGLGFIDILKRLQSERQARIPGGMEGR